MCLIWLYQIWSLCTKYEVCGWYSIWNMANTVYFNFFYNLGTLTLTFTLISHRLLDHQIFPFYQVFNSVAQTAPNMTNYLFISFFYKFYHDLWSWLHQDHCLLGHQMHLIGLHLCTKYEICGWNGLLLSFMDNFGHLTLSFVLVNVIIAPVNVLCLVPSIKSNRLCLDKI